MTIQSIKQPKQWLVPAAIVLTLAGLFVARTAFAKILINTIDPVGIVAHNGRHVTLTGPPAITAGEQAALTLAEMPSHTHTTPALDFDGWVT